MMMDVDAERFFGRLRERAATGGSPERGEAAEKAPAAATAGMGVPAIVADRRQLSFGWRQSHAFPYRAAIQLV
jgi:hypothetical protein